MGGSLWGRQLLERVADAEEMGPPGFDHTCLGPLFATKLRKISDIRFMVDSRQKGASFERDIVRRLNDFFVGHGFDVACKRNLDQYQTNNLCDIEIPFHAIECKAYKDGWWWRPEWWKQVCESAKDRIPVLVYKFNNKQPRVCVPMYAINPVLPRDNALTTVMTFDDWLAIMRTNWESYQDACSD